MRGGIFSPFMQPMLPPLKAPRVAAPVPDMQAALLAEKQEALEAQKALLDTTCETLGQVRGAIDAEKVTLDLAKREKRLIKIFGGGQFVLNSVLGAMSGWEHDTTGETNAEVLKSGLERLKDQDAIILDAQLKLDALSRKQQVLETWTDMDEAKLRRLMNEVNALKARSPGA